MRWLHAMRSRARFLFARRAAESRMEEEFRFHIDMESERLVLWKAMSQVAIGIVVGVGLIPLMQWALDNRWDGWRDALFLLAVGAIMWGVSLIAAIGPARRALRIQPTEALKAE